MPPIRRLFVRESKIRNCEKEENAAFALGLQIAINAIVQMFHLFEVWTFPDHLVHP